MNVFVSKVSVDGRDPNWRDLQDPNAWKGLLWRMFPGHAENDPTFIFRQDRKPGILSFLVLSAEKPLPSAFGGRPIRVESKIIDMGFEVGSVIPFRCRFTPMVRSRIDGRVVDRYSKDPNDILSVLQSRLDGAGEITEFSIVDSGFHNISKRDQSFTIYWVDAIFSLRVSDSEKLCEAMRDGVSKKRRYGMGMMVPAVV